MKKNHRIVLGCVFPKCLASSLSGRGSFWSFTALGQCCRSISHHFYFLILFSPPSDDAAKVFLNIFIWWLFAAEVFLIFFICLLFLFYIWETQLVGFYNWTNLWVCVCLFACLFVFHRGKLLVDHKLGDCCLLLVKTNWLSCDRRLFPLFSFFFAKTNWLSCDRRLLFFLSFFCNNKLTGRSLQHTSSNLATWCHQATWPPNNLRNS